MISETKIQKLIEEYKQEPDKPLNICCIGHIIGFVDDLEDLLK